jgi:hypothetical protein
MTNDRMSIGRRPIPKFNKSAQAPATKPVANRIKRSVTMTLTPEEQITLTSVAEQMACEMSEEQLLREIGLRARTFAMYPAAASSVERSVPEAAALERAWDDLSEFGNWIFRRLNRQLYSVPAGDQSYDDTLQPLNGFGRSDTSAANSIVSVLTATLGVAPAIASVVTALALKRLLKPGWDETYAPQAQLVSDAQ